MLSPEDASRSATGWRHDGSPRLPRALTRSRFPRADPVGRRAPTASRWSARRTAGPLPLVAAIAPRVPIAPPPASPVAPPASSHRLSPSHGQRPGPVPAPDPGPQRVPSRPLRARLRARPGPASPCRARRGRRTDRSTACAAPQAPPLRLAPGRRVPVRRVCGRPCGCRERHAAIPRVRAAPHKFGPPARGRGGRPRHPHRACRLRPALASGRAGPPDSRAPGYLRLGLPDTATGWGRAPRPLVSRFVTRSRRGTVRTPDTASASPPSAPLPIDRRPRPGRARCVVAGTRAGIPSTHPRRLARPGPGSAAGTRDYAGLPATATGRGEVSPGPLPP